MAKNDLLIEQIVAARRLPDNGRTFHQLRRQLAQKVGKDRAGRMITQATAKTR